MKTLPTAIPSDKLKATDIPSKFSSWSDIVEFVTTFDPRSEIHDGAAIKGIADVTEASTVREIRAALFFEYRRYNHFGYEPEPTVFKAALDAIAILKSKAQQGKL